MGVCSLSCFTLPLPGRIACPPRWIHQARNHLILWQVRPQTRGLPSLDLGRVSSVRTRENPRAAVPSPVPVQSSQPRPEEWVPGMETHCPCLPPGVPLTLVFPLPREMRGVCLTLHVDTYTHTHTHVEAVPRADPVTGFWQRTGGR